MVFNRVASMCLALKLSDIRAIGESEGFVRYWGCREVLKLRCQIIGIVGCISWRLMPHKPTRSYFGLSQRRSCTSGQDPNREKKKNTSSQS
jgi:hypothetical protein